MDDAVDASPGEKPKAFKSLLGILEKLLVHLQWPQVERTQGHRVSRFGLFQACCKNFKEASSGVIDLPDDRADAVNALLWYGMRNLCQLAEAKFEKHATTGWRSDGFADAIIEMSLTSPDSKRVLLKIAAEIAITHAGDLFTGEETRFQETVRNVAPFAFKVTSILLESRQSNLLVTEKRLRCVICARSFIIDTNPGTTSISCWYCGICQYVDRFEALEI